MAEELLFPAAPARIVPARNGIGTIHDEIIHPPLETKNNGWKVGPLMMAPRTRNEPDDFSAHDHASQTTMMTRPVNASEIK
ncbi:MAG TPA: hypothetical protein VHB49_22200 [Bradyrhizobium sp.]|nr:hypothetical protein [Bradyrhizobium sp.]